jgi:hypothetical protein
VTRATIVKALIVLGVFPVFAHLIFTVVTVPLRPALAPLFEEAGGWSGLLDKGFVIGTIVLAMRASFAVCRRLWPSPTFRELTQTAPPPCSSSRTNTSSPASTAMRTAKPSSGSTRN